MSRTLRRPMFRGGQVDSRGTGITSGLDDGYATGGRVGYSTGVGPVQIGWTKPPVLPDWVAPAEGDSWLRSLKNLINPNFNSNAGKLLPTASGEAALAVPESAGTLRGIGQILGNTLRNPGSLVSTPASLGLSAAALSYAGTNYLANKSQEYWNSLPEEEKRNQLKYRAQFGETPFDPMGNVTGESTYTPDSSLPAGFTPKRSSISDLLPSMSDIIPFWGKEKEAQKPTNYDGSGKNVGNAMELFYGNQKKSAVNEDDEFDKFYDKALEKLGGGDKANKQAIFDTMLAASPGFFKGRTLKEAAPNVLEGIIKSGALDRPQKLRQAAAEVALNRQIGIEKIREQEKAREALYSQRLLGAQTPESDLKAIKGAVPKDTAVVGIAPGYIGKDTPVDLKNPKSFDDETRKYVDNQPKGTVILARDKSNPSIGTYILITGKDPKTRESIFHIVGQKGMGRAATDSSKAEAEQAANYYSPAQ